MGIVIIAVIILALAITFGSDNSKKSSQLGSDQQTSVTGQSSRSSVLESSSDTVIININASRWDYSPNKVTVNKGDRVKIVVNNIDTNHGISIPNYGVFGIGEVEFIANRTGTFSFYCPTFCGSGHREMTGTLIVK